jgi:hypothetical protein
MAASHDDGGYWLVAATGGVLTFGDTVFYGPSPNEPPFSPTAAIAATPDGKGYWLLQPDDIAASFGTPPSSASPQQIQAVSVAASQIGETAQGAECNPYGPCEQWCALFATWVWNQAGIGIPRYSFTGDVYDWVAQHGIVLAPTTSPEPGDGVLFGTGPANTDTSVHMGIVAEVWPDGAITTIEGDSGPEPMDQMAVTFNGPFLPADSEAFLGMPIYAFIRP